MSDCCTIQGWVTEKKYEWRKINDSKQKFKSNNYKGHRNPGKDINLAIKKMTKRKRKKDVKHRQHKKNSECKRKYDKYEESSDSHHHSSLFSDSSNNMYSDVSFKTTFDH
eukprot:scaffold18865_cov55-Attheya_sp.AAC.3